MNNVVAVLHLPFVSAISVQSSPPSASLTFSSTLVFAFAIHASSLLLPQLVRRRRHLLLLSLLLCTVCLCVPLVRLLTWHLSSRNNSKDTKDKPVDPLKAAALRSIGIDVDEEEVS